MKAHLNSVAGNEPKTTSETKTGSQPHRGSGEDVTFCNSSVSPRKQTSRGRKHDLLKEHINSQLPFLVLANQ